MRWFRKTSDPPSEWNATADLAAVRPLLPAWAIADRQALMDGSTEGVGTNWRTLRPLGLTHWGSGVTIAPTRGRLIPADARLTLTFRGYLLDFASVPWAPHLSFRWEREPSLEVRAYLADAISLAAEETLGMLAATALIVPDGGQPPDVELFLGEMLATLDAGASTPAV